MDYPSFLGFKYDHPILVHWRKEHPMSPGSEEAFFPPLVQVRWTLGFGGIFAVLLPFVLGIKGLDTLWIVSLWLTFGFTMACARHLNNRITKMWSSESEFVQAFNEVTSRMYISKRDLVGGRWDWVHSAVRAELVKLAVQVLFAEERHQDDPLSFQPEFRREEFRKAHSAAKTLGLVSGSYNSIFDDARKQMAPGEDSLSHAG